MPANMVRGKFYFGDVSLLITHYNRSSSLERLLKSFKDLDISFKETVVSDDCSKPEHLDYIKNELKSRYDFTLVTTEKNKGLANNINKGQAVITTPYTLYVQEDFVPKTEFIPHFKDAVEIIGDDQSVDIIRFYTYVNYPYLKPYKKGFSEMLYRPWYLNTIKIYGYSDHPHLRKSNFTDRFGKYLEGVKSDYTEYAMCVSFIQNKGKALFYNDFKGLFDQINSSAEPSTVTRSNWRQSNNVFTTVIRWIYRITKYNYDIHFGKSMKQDK